MRWFPHAAAYAALVFALAAQLQAAGWSTPELRAQAEELEGMRKAVATQNVVLHRLAVAEALLAQYGAQVQLLPGHGVNIQGGTTTTTTDGILKGGTTRRLGEGDL